MSDTPLELKTPQGDVLKVDPLGAKIEVSLGGTLILGSFTRGDGKQGITHPCTPIFGPDRNNIYGLQQHGNMRNEVCEVRQEGDKIIVSHDIIDAGYPAGMKVEQVMWIEDGTFYFEMTHTNTDGAESAVNCGEHCYFDAPQGFEGTTVNGQDITDLIKNNFDGMAIDLKETNSIQIPGKPEYVLKQQGFNKAVVWVGKKPDTKEVDKTYICIEPVEEDPFGDFFGSQKSMIYPGKSRTCKFSLQLET